MLDFYLAIAPLVPSLILLLQIYDKSDAWKIFISISISIAGYWMTTLLIPVIGQYTLKSGLSGKDLGKRGTSRANINVPEANMLTIQVWDSSLIRKIENSIIDSKLGINPQSDGALIRLPIPKLSEERRNELSKVASQYSESSKISIRNVRRDGIDQLKAEEKDKIISQDEQKFQSIDIQKITDEYIKTIEEIVLIKKNEILKV